MKNKYKDLIEQTFDFPQEEFSVEDNELNLYDIPLMEIIKQYGTPLKVTYLPKISSQIARAKRMFNVAMAKVAYKGCLFYTSTLLRPSLLPSEKHPRNTDTLRRRLPARRRSASESLPPSGMRGIRKRRSD